ncbi:hypothetical protein QCN29_09875 [Streptomyces sp. HNM0663]|uniref:Uncharacterized protein n=1 Tax=Streptomyces chengmaiensis TaxID=3040919 RepID=A0ABT6HM12_9ACTN|nr:hypothetical protein [Streptomyces chengmaiensis]MDH2389094.1 hypothetical protein [Streptomyces chengmaiensis]
MDRKELEEVLKGFEERISEKLEKKMDAKLDQFAMSFVKHMNERFDAVDRRFEEVDRKIDKVQSSVDEVHGMLEMERDERTVISHQLDRHEDWIERAARKLNIEYDQAA